MGYALEGLSISRLKTIIVDQNLELEHHLGDSAISKMTDMLIYWLLIQRENPNKCDFFHTNLFTEWRLKKLIKI